jgi:plastocyanin
VRAAAAARAAAVACAALAAGGCGEDRSTSAVTQTDPVPPQAPADGEAPAVQGPPPATVTVLEREYRLDPARIRVDRPATLEIGVRNRGRARHALAVVTPAGEERTRTLGPRQSATLAVDLGEPGRYRWYCPVGDHADRGMRGSITVAKGG